LGLTGSFLPGVSLLFGALFSYTISLLVRDIALSRCFNDISYGACVSSHGLLWRLLRC